MKIRYRIVSVLLVLSLVFNIFLVFYTIKFLNYKNYYTEKVRENYYYLFAKRNKNIVFIGDSLIENNDWKKSFRNDDIINIGKSGITIKELYKQIDIAKRIIPSKIFVLIGINDLRYGSTTNYLIQEYKAMFTYIKKELPFTSIYTISPLPIIEDQIINNQTNNDSINSVNLALKPLCKKFNIEFIDIHTNFELVDSLDPALTYDGLHLNTKGYQKMTNFLFGFINS